ncbi:MAG TPA: Kdo hydroxylase family protein [Candidatus Obscuribacterales bacterium]
MLQQSTAVAYQVFMTDGSGNITEPQAGPRAACAYLERGGIIFFPRSPFHFSREDHEFLLSQEQESADYRKNIAFRPAEGRVTGKSKTSQADVARLRDILASYSRQVQELMKNFLEPYARGWRVDFASFRPIEEKGRKARLRARNDLLHVDSFPTRPVYGDRILRVFTNMNPTDVRVWNTSDTFEKLAQDFKDQVSSPGRSNHALAEQFPALQSLAQLLGIKLSAASAYDSWMTDFHNFLKENTDFQNFCRKMKWEFPAGSSWIVYTDMVSHAVLSGQYALEQTFIISQNDMVLPDKAPINILRRLYGGDCL